MKKFREISFEWDQWNIQKNEEKHGIASLEAESVFFDEDLGIFNDIKHSTEKEKIFIAYGLSNKNKIVMIAFTIRKQKIRIISARTASAKERSMYEKNKKETKRS